jgi:hypothetical protein
MKIQIKPKENSKLLANVDITIETQSLGELTIKNFQIWKSEILNSRLGEKVNISPPTLGHLGNHFKIVFFEEPDCWEMLEKVIWEKYTEETTGERNPFPS